MKQYAMHVPAQQAVGDGAASAGKASMLPAGCLAAQLMLKASGIRMVSLAKHGAVAQLGRAPD